MDSITEDLVQYAASFSRDDLEGPALTATLHHLVDTVAVAIPGVGSEPARIATELARRWRIEDGATVFGASLRTSPDLAAFANAIMVRTYDWNDGMQAKGGGHPSDMIPGILAIGELTHATGMDVLVSVALAYEVLGGFGSATDREYFDQGLFMGIAIAVAGGRLLELDKQAMANAASLAATTALPLQVNRWGALSMMKGAATAFAVRNGVFSAMLAHDGFTSTDTPFEGYYGMWHAKGEFRPKLPVLPGGPYVVEMSHQKPVPAETQVLGLLDLVPEIRAWTAVDDIESIEIEMSERAVRHVADPPKYDPKTRETADHSLPYMLAVALVDGTITLDSYDPERFLDPALRPVMQKIRVSPNERYTEIRNTGHFGVALPTPASIVIRARTGERFEREVMYHKGHMRDPMTRADLDAKWESTCRGRIDDARRDELREAWWDAENAEDIADLVAMLADLGRPPSSASRVG